MIGPAATRLLLVEDNAGDARLLRELFDEPGAMPISVTHVERMSDAEAHLEGSHFDLILLDLQLPDAEGLDAVRRVRSAAPHVPLVVLTGQDDESLAIQTLQAGAQDYLVKGQVGTRGVERGIRYAIERTALEDALFIEKERAEVTLRSIGDAVLSTDVAGNVTFLNIVAEQLTGSSWQDALGRPINEIIHLVDGASRRIAVPMDAAIDRDETVHLPSDTILVRADGVEIPIDDTISPIHDAVGRAVGAVIVFRDVTVARSLAVRMQAVDAELARSNRELQDFATIASHDLQEPLRKIQAFSDLLEEQASGVLDHVSEDYLRRMRAAAARMQALIDGLLEYSRITLRPEPPGPVDLAQVVAEVLTDLEERIRTTDAQVVVGTLPTLLGNPLQMRQLFQNLIANALKFHPDGIAPEVHVEATPRRHPTRRRGRVRANEVWEIRISDNGIGFEEGDVEKIFAPFLRLNGRQAYEGTGMGLAICRRIVAMGGGTITATSRPGAGATFLVTLPQSPAASAGERRSA